MKIEEPLVSVIIPNYNHARYIDQRIQSILCQTYKNYEVIILDDCSTDNSVEKIEKYKNDSRISTIIVNENNTGVPFKQWHKGMLLAKGSLIWIAESDDLCEPNFLESLVKAIDKDNNCVLAFCKMIAFTDNGEKWVKTPDTLSAGIYDSRYFISNFLALRNSIVNASGVIFKKETALKVDSQYMTFKGVGDWMFWVELAECGSIAYIDNGLSHFRQHANNMTKSNVLSGTNTFDRKQILDYIFSKGHIDSIKYNEIKERIIINEVFGIPSWKIRRELLNHWEPSFIKKVNITAKIYLNHIKWLITSYFSRNEI